MSLRAYLITVTAGTAISWAAWAFVLFNIDPVLQPVLGPALFYCSLFLALSGTFSLVGFFLRLVFVRGELPYHFIGVSFRQSLLFAALLVGALLLQSQRFFTWWNAILFVVAVTILEFFFVTRNANAR